MGKYAPSVRRSNIKPERPHPVWRGIGCLIMIIVPVLSYAAASVTMPALREAGLVPYDLMGTPRVPDWMWISPVVAGFFQRIIGRPMFSAIMLLTVLYIIFLGGFFSFAYALLYRFVGPPRYGPTDAEPVRKKIRKYTR